MVLSRGRVVLVAAVTAGVTLSTFGVSQAGNRAAQTQAVPQVVAITVLSGRADQVAGGSALLQVNLPTGARGLHVTAGSRDVTTAFGTAGNGSTQGLVNGLPLGATVVTATVDDGRGAHITLVGHPIGGPTFSGPQILPWACQAGATDAQCDAPTVVDYKYKSAATSQLQPYDPHNPPPATAIATTKTDTGVTLPFIVREETGYLDRDQFATAVLDDPSKPWTPLSLNLPS